MTNSTDLFGELRHSAHLPSPKPKSRQAQLGQYLTPPSVAKFMAELFPVSDGDVRLLDAGAGKGALTTAFISRWRDRAGRGQIIAHAFELDAMVLPELQRATAQLSEASKVKAEVIEGDFLEKSATMIRLARGPRYTHAILNPPYKKINTNSQHRALIRLAGLETVNLYSGFVGLAVALMERGGEVVAIIPRSFCNGPYYEPFRRFILSRAAIRHIHLFDARNKAFKDDGVLQENIIIRLTCGVEQGDVKISTSEDDTFSDYSETVRPFNSIVLPGDADQFIHIPTGNDENILTKDVFRFRLEQLGLSVSTGPVVDFRMRDDLRDDPELGTVPLLYPGHFTSSGMEWPKPGFKKPNAIRFNAATTKWLFPSGYYAVVRRFSSKEERRRIIANVVEPGILGADMIGFENHLNLFHEKKRPLDEAMARGLALYLNATVVDQYFRRFNGHTQVNATDLRTLPYPSRASLTALGKWASKHRQATQEQIDKQVAKLS